MKCKPNDVVRIIRNPQYQCLGCGRIGELPMRDKFTQVTYVLRPGDNDPSWIFAEPIYVDAIKPCGTHFTQGVAGLPDSYLQPMRGEPDTITNVTTKELENV